MRNLRTRTEIGLNKKNMAKKSKKSPQVLSIEAKKKRLIAI